MKEPTHERTDNRIKDLQSGVLTEYDSINKAKQMSRALQKGGSVVRVVDTRPEPVVRAHSPKVQFGKKKRAA